MGLNPSIEALLPRENPNLIGHRTAENTFVEAWSQGRLAHAWLISGPRGVGKASLAYRMARYALASERDCLPRTQAQELVPEAYEESQLCMDPHDPIFRKIAGLSHGDFRAVERAWADTKQTKRKTYIGVNEVRGLEGFLSLTPAESGWRVIVVDAADEMNSNAANAILKLLEEPPRKAILFLVSHNPARLLPTIRSRCRKLSLNPLTDEQLKALIGKYRPMTSPTETETLAVIANGSIGRALEIMDQGGIALFHELVTLLKELPNLQVTKLHAFVEKVSNEEIFRNVSELLTWWLGRIISLTARHEWGSTNEIFSGEADLVHRLTAAMSLDQWIDVWEKVSLLFARTESHYLDRKRTILGALVSIQEEVRG